MSTEHGVRMFFIMFAKRSNFEILSPVVKTVAIKVMDYFMSFKFSPDMFFHNKPVLAYSLFTLAGAYYPVAFRVNGASSRLCKNPFFSSIPLITNPF